MANALGITAECSIIGVQPKTLDFGDRLSEEVKGSVPEIINLIITEANKYAKKSSCN
jgi:Ni,Fe-hydrogenase maturation factor